MLPYKDLLKKTPLNIMRNSKNCRTRKYKAEKALTEDGYVVQVIIRTKDPSHKGSGRTHNQVIRYNTDEKGKINKGTPIWVSCECENWKFVQEYAVWVAESTSIIHCNGQFPKEKNKLLESGLCKHLIKAIPKALKEKPKEVKELTPLSSLGWTVKKD